MGRPMIGTMLDGRYRILRKLGEGAMGEVYLAEHVNLGRKEALKILQPALAAEPQFVERFRREARATNRVQHPNVVSVHDFGQLPDGRFLLAMEYIEGESLGALVDRIGRLPVPRALHILAQLADAVDHAHAHGVVHRDLKPENMMLVEHRGQADIVKVLDFGIAKIVAPDHKSVGLTRQGQVFGTPAYMAPEQFASLAPDPRSDLYAFGVIAFELVTGETPFSGRMMELMRAHLTDIPDAPSERRPEARIPEELDALVRRCLEKEPAKRFQTGKEVRHALERVPGFETRGSGVRRRRRAGTAGASDFDGGDTAEATWGGTSEVDALREGVSYRELSIYVPVAPDAKLLAQEAVRELAEIYLDFAAKDTRLVLGIADAKELEQELSRHDSQMEATERRIAELEQSAREREGGLRFALGELSFERAHGKSHVDKTLGAEIARLERRLSLIASELERDVAVLVDQSISVAAARATTEEKLDTTYAQLERVVLEIAPYFGEIPAAAQRLEQLRILRSARHAGGPKERA